MQDEMRQSEVTDLKILVSELKDIIINLKKEDN